MVRPVHLLPAGPPASGFDAIYGEWIDEVLRWLGAMGCAYADADDLAQDVFIVVDRQLARFDGRNLGGWLYGIARRVAASHRRRAWIRNLFFRRVELAGCEPPLTPSDLLDRKRAQTIVEHVLARMSHKRRRAFALFEIEGYSGDEIAALEGVPVKTIWTRLHHARKDFARLAGAFSPEERE